MEINHDNVKKGACMTVKKFLIIFIFSILSLPKANSFHIDNFFSGKLGDHSGPQKKCLRRFFSPGIHTLNDFHVVTDPKSLLEAVKDTLRYFDAHKKTEINYPQNGLISCSDVKHTLKFIKKIIEEDLKTGSFRILNPDFIQKNFNVLKWKANTIDAQRFKQNFPSDGKIRVTHYAIFCTKGSNKKTSDYPYALYSLQDHSLQKKYTKQEILSGALEDESYRDKVKPLVWLNRKGIEEALMQGTIAIHLPNKITEIFSLDCDNGIPYKKNIQNPWNQNRYWFFRRKAKAPEHSHHIAKKISQRANVIFAGDIESIGVGKIVAIKYQDPTSGKESLRLGVLADTGGAFSNNLYQLDLFAGIFSSRQHFTTHLKKQPEFAEAFILYRPA